MRGATECARRVKQLLRTLRTRLGKVTRPQASDATTQMILGILSRDMPESKAREALEKMRSMVVDYNELRVIPPMELAEQIGDYPEVRSKCEDVCRALNKVFALDHSVGMERLTEMSPKDAAAYLDKIDGLEAYTRARIRLLALRHHAIPLDEAMWAYAKSEGIVDPKADLDEAQRFLERQVSEEDAPEFVALLRKQAWSEMATAVRKGDVSRIRSIPPDRTSRNMLQPILPVAPAPVSVDEDEKLAETAAPQARGARSARSKRPVAASTEKAATAPRKSAVRKGGSPRAAGARASQDKAAPRPARKSRTRAKSG